MKFLLDKNFYKLEVVIPAMFFSGYFLPPVFAMFLGSILFPFLYLYKNMAEKRVFILFAFFLLFSGQAIKHRDSVTENESFRDIRAPGFIVEQREKLTHSISFLNNRQFIKALALGEREFSESFRESLIVTGTMHLVAISAFHTGIMIMIINIVFTFLLLFVPVRPSVGSHSALAVKWMVSYYYFYITGGSIPTLRALIFILAYDTVYSSGKRPSPLILYFYSLVFVSVSIPKSLGSISFVMSALCVATVLHVWNRLPGSYIIKIVSVSIIVNYILLPVSTDLTGTFPLASPVVNVFVIPLVSLSVPFVSLAQFSAFSPDISLMFLRIADIVISPVVFYIDSFNEFASRMMLPLVSPPVYVKMLFVFSFFMALNTAGNRKNFFITCNLLFLIPFLFSFQPARFKVVVPQNLYGRAQCIVFSDSSGKIFFEPERNNPGTTVRFYQRMERAASECGINRVKSITSGQEFPEEAKRKLRKKMRFKNTAFISYHPDRYFDSDPLCESSLQEYDPAL